MRLIKCILTENDCYKAGKKIKPKGVMVHSTGANNTSIKRYVQPDVCGIGVNKNKNDWNRPGVKKCVHAFIGKLADGSIATVQTLPWDWRGWHCGDDANGTHISFEICEDGLTDKTYFDKVYAEAVQLTAYLCKLYNLDPTKDGVVICHSEGAKRGIASNHADVLHWFPKHNKDMDDFRADVKKAIGGEKKTEEKPVKVEAAKSFDKSFNKSWTATASNGLNLRSGAGTNKDIIATLKKGTKFRCYGYYTKMSDGSIWLYGVSGGKTGFCSKKYLG